MNNRVKDISSGIGWILKATFVLLAITGAAAFFIASPTIRGSVFLIIIVLVLIGIAYGFYRWARNEGQRIQDNLLWKIFGIIFLLSLFVYTLRSTEGCDTGNYHEDVYTGIASGEIICPEYVEEQHRETAKKNAIYFFIASSIITGVGYSRGTKQKEKTKKE